MITEEEVKLLNQESLAGKNLEIALNLINESDGLKDWQKEELKTILTDLFLEVLPYFRSGTEANPIYHHTQVLNNMVQIGLGEKLPYEELRNALILALLHDIGNAISESPKVTNSEIEDVLDPDKPEDIKRDIAQKFKLEHIKDNVELAKRLAEMAIEFRLEHMDKGPELARKVLQPYLDAKTLSGDDLNLICEAIKIHDYPTVEKTLKFLREKGISVNYPKGHFLLPFDDSPFGRLITFLREADRLFMVSYQGVVKDLDDKKEITADDIRSKLESNMKSHRDEYRLYKDANRDVGRFIQETLYRTATGYSIFINAKDEIEKEIQKRQSNDKGLRNQNGPMV